MSYISYAVGFLTLTVVLSVYCRESTMEQNQLFYGQPSAKFITQYAFKEYAHFYFDPEKKALIKKSIKQIVKPCDVQAGDSVFVRAPKVFLAEVHPYIQQPYILITHGDVCDGFNDAYMSYLEDPKIIAWFGIHPTTRSHPKFFPIPLGVIARPVLSDNYEKTSEMFADLRTVKKSNLLYMNFADPHRSDRKLCRKLFEDKPFCLVGDRKPLLDYFKEMATCKFSLSPRGIGIDCYRTWEALLVGSIPIVKSSQLDPLYRDLPILVIDDWKKIDERFLEQKYKEIMAKRYSMQKLASDYWCAQIEKVRQGFLAHYNAYSDNAPQKNN